MKQKIISALKFFGPMNPIEMQNKLGEIGMPFSLDYISNEMFLMADSGEIRFSDISFSLPENRFYKF